MPEVTLEHVSKQFPGGVLALRDLSLRVNDGEFIVLVGPSGCGKTTTLRLIAGLEEPTSGTIRIDDRVVNRVHPRDRNIAMVFQDSPLYPHMSAYQNLAFGLKTRKLPKREIDERVLATATALGISDLLNRKPRALSGGQRQRIALGRAIVRQPQCFLFDEPLSNLDAKMRAGLRAEIRSLHLRFKTTTIYVTHDQEEAMILGQRLIVMSNGVVQQIAQPMDVYRAPANRFVAGFFGSPTMNFIDGRLRRNDSRIEFTDGRTICVPAPPGLEPFIGRHVVLGVRPEHVQPADQSTAAHAAPISLKVTFTEVLGDQMNLYTQTTDGLSIIARLKTQPSLRSGATLALAVDPRDLNFFEPGSFGRNLLYRDAATGNS